LHDPRFIRNGTNSLLRCSNKCTLTVHTFHIVSLEQTAFRSGGSLPFPISGVPQMPVTQGAGKIKQENITLYHLLCGCGDPKCTLLLTVEYDKLADDVVVSFEGELISASTWFADAHWYTNLWDRVKHSMRILFTGSTECKFDFRVSSCDHLYGIVGALLEARRRMQRAGKPFNNAGRLEDKSGSKADSL